MKRDRSYPERVRKAFDSSEVSSSRCESHGV